MKSNNLFVHIEGQGQPLVLLHGWGNDSSVWLECIKTWRHSFKVFAIDLPGHGKSQIVHGGMSSWLDAFVQTLLVFELKKPILMGWSLGGILAKRLLEKMPDDFFKAYFGVCTSPCFVKKKGWEHGISQNNWVHFLSRLNHDHQKTFKDFLHLQCLGSQRNQVLTKYIQKIQKLTHPPDVKMLKTGAEILKNTDDRFQLNHNVPMYYFLGKKDRLVPPSLSDYFHAHSIKNYLGEKWAHMPFLSHFKDFNQQFLVFLDDL